jgi:two-component system OmpR family response regulator
VQLDPRGKRLIAVEKTVQLSSTEFAIIEYLFKNAGAFYTAEQLFEALWPSETETTSEVVPVHIRVLRRKCSDAVAWLCKNATQVCQDGC